MTCVHVCVLARIPLHDLIWLYLCTKLSYLSDELDSDNIVLFDVVF